METAPPTLLDAVHGHTTDEVVASGRNQASTARREPARHEPRRYPRRHGTARPPRDPPPDDARGRPGAGGDPRRARRSPAGGAPSTSTGSWPTSSTAIPRRTRSSSSTAARSSATSRPSRRTSPTSASAGIDLFLRTDAQGRGLGPDAIRTLAIELIDGRGHHRLTIDPAADNERAIAAYSKLGFRPVGRHAALPANDRRPLGRRSPDGPPGRRTGALTLARRAELGLSGASGSLGWDRTRGRRDATDPDTSREAMPR